ncbi:hypothetical protein F4779DRAFT_639013 [Xylariaceae sp. FL0662B]|nr:hypothetical protein F4779DRAFT_639013 [Xylariaceae sp. FL0662B]
MAAALGLPEIDYNDDDEPVCDLHKLRICHLCCLDFTNDDDSDDDADVDDGLIKSYCRDIDPVEESQTQLSVGEAQLYELAGLGDMNLTNEDNQLQDEKIQEWYPHFVPQWDEQVYGRRTLSHSLGEPEEEFVGNWNLRLVIATDSSYLVECLCSHIKKWSFEPLTKTYRNAKGKSIKNSDLFAAISNEVRLLSQEPEQVLVLWYHIGREFNTQADQLAHHAVDRKVPFARRSGPGPGSRP